MKNGMRSLIVALSLVILICQNAFAAITTNMEISQVVQDASGISMYANLMDDQGNSTGESFTKDKFTGMIDGNEFAADSAINFNSTGEGIYYVVCVDISKSLNNEDMANIRSGLEKFISYLNPADYMSIYAFGSEVKPLAVESNSKDELLAVVAGLQCSDMNTQLYGVINEALSLTRVRSASMPERSAVIVMTDGTDDPSAGKGDLYTYDNTFNIVKESGTPVYTIAVEKNNQQLDNLEAFANASGGDLVKVKTSGIADELNGMRMQIRNATLVHVPLVNEDGKNGIGTHEIGLVLSIGDKKVVASNPYSMDIDWFAVPAIAPEETATAEPVATPTPEAIVTATSEPIIEEVTEAQTEPAAVAEASSEEEPTGNEDTELINSADEDLGGNLGEIITDFGDYIWFICAAAFILIAVIIILIVLLTGKRKKKKAQQMVDWGNEHVFNSAWDTNSAYDFARTDSDINGSGNHSAPTERIGSQAAHAAPTERIGQAAHAAPTERIGQAAHAAPTERIGQVAHAAPTERIGQVAHAAPTERIGQANAQPVAAVADLTASSGTVRLAPQESGIKILIEERRRAAGVDNTRFVYLEKVLIFGRDFDCDYVIQDDAASGEHFKLTREVDGIYITDLKSKNGTMLNGKTLYAATALRSEDVVKAGVTTLRIRFEN